MTTYLSEPHGASACAENSATAAKAAVLQLAGEAAPRLQSEHQNPTDKVKASSKPCPTIVRHPSASLHADVVSAIIPAIEVFAAHKNVAVAAHEYDSLARHALSRVSHKTLRSVLVGNEHAMKSIFSAVDRTLDVHGAANLTAALFAAEGRAVPDAATLFRMSEASMKGQFANDKQPVMCVWPDVEPIAKEHRKRISQRHTQPSTLTMPSGAMIQCAVRQATKGWGAVIRAATPLIEGATHE